MNTDLFPRPWCIHKPKVKNFRPLIRAEIKRVSKRKKNAWRSRIFVGESPMCHSHHNSKTLAELDSVKMLEAYTEAHYITS